MYLFSEGTLEPDVLRAWADEVALGWEDEKPVPDSIRRMAQRIGFTVDAFSSPNAEAKRLLAHLGPEAPDAA